MLPPEVHLKNHGIIKLNLVKSHENQLETLLLKPNIINEYIAKLRTVSIHSN